MTRVVVTGASGMLGNAVFREALARGMDARGWSKTTERTPDGLEFEAFDLLETDPGGWSGCQHALWGESVDLIVHCAALTDADYCEKNTGEAAAFNALLPGHLAAFAKEMSARFIYISTDAVYDGTKPGRHEEDEMPGPASVYARTKLEGEGRVLSAYPDALVVRTTMFGWTLPGAPRPKFAEEILAALRARRHKSLWSDAKFSPLYVADLANVILDLAETDASGVLNVGAREPISKYAFGVLLAEHFGLSSAYLNPTSVDDSGLAAQRPKNVGMNVKRAEKIYGPLPTVGDSIEWLYQSVHDGTAEAIRGRTTYP